MSSTGLVFVLAAVYALIGLGIGLMLWRRKQPIGVVFCSVVAWPLLVSLVSSEENAGARGPLAVRIDAVAEALLGALEAAGEGGSAGEVESLRRALYAADRRIAAVDALLASDVPVHTPDLDATRSRLECVRAHAFEEVERVLGAMAELRLQVGILTLSGETRPVSESLRALRERLAAVQEVAGLPGVEYGSPRRTG